MARSKHFDKTARIGTWISLGNESMVRLLELSATQWNVEFDLTKYLLAYNQLGGLIAVYGKGIARMENIIAIFSSSGLANSAAPKVQLGGTEEVLFMCWNQQQDHLIVVLNDKTVRFFSYSGTAVFPNMQLGALPQVFASTRTGLVGVTPYLGDSPASLYLVNFTERDGYTLRTTNLPSSFQKIVPTTSLLAIPGKLTETGFPEVFLPCLTTPLFSGIYRCVFTPHPKIIDLKLSIAGGTVQKMAVSPRGRSIAFVMEDGSLYFANRSLEEVIKAPETPEVCTSLLWCGERCVALQTSPDPSDFESEQTSSVMVVNSEDPSYNDYIYDLPADLVMFAECDGIRFLGREGFCQMLQVVGEDVQRVFSVGSHAIGAVLLSTYDEFMAGAAAASVSTIRDLRERCEELTEAINDCVAAAAAEFDYDQQKRLLRIAAFGKSFCPVYDSDYFVNTTRRIRVRNTLATSSTGMLLSHAQMLELGDERLLRRLVQSHHHQIAHCICTTLGIKPDDVVMDWALAKLSSAMVNRPGPEQERAVARKIVVKVRRTEPTVSFAELARLANMRGHRVGALAFLEGETNIMRQVPMLLSVGEPEAALKQAVRCNNADLIFSVVTQLLGSQGSRATEVISSYEESRAILLEYMAVSESHRDVMTGFFNRHPKYQTALNLRGYFAEEKRLLKSFSTASTVSAVNWEMLQECKSAAAQSSIISVRKEVEKAVKASAAPSSTVSAFSPTSSSPPTVVTNERFLRMHLNLIQDQSRLMRELDDSRFLTASVTDMVRFALEHGKESVAAKLKSDYSIPEKMYQWCKLSAYSQTGQWDLIDELGGVTSRVQPLIGGEAFVTLLFSFGRRQQASQYVARISRIELRMEYYVQCGDWFAAAADCRKHGENDLVAQLRDRAKGDASLLQQINDGWGSQQEPTINFSKLFGSS